MIAMTSGRLVALVLVLGVAAAAVSPTDAAKVAGDSAGGPGSSAEAQAPPARTVVSDPDAASAGSREPAPGEAGRHKAHTLSSTRARGKPRPAQAADPVQVQPPVIVPQVRLPVNANGSASPKP